MLESRARRSDPRRLGRRRGRQPAVPRRRRDRGRQDRRGRPARCALRPRTASSTRPARSSARLRRPAQPQRLLDPREPDRGEHDPPGRHDRGRRQLRLELRARHAGFRADDPQPSALVRLRQADDPLVDVRRAPRVPLGRRPHAELRLVRRPQRDPARSGGVRLDPDLRAAGGDGGLRRGGDAVGSARDVDRARVQPGAGGDGRGADATERSRRPSTTASTRATSATATRACSRRSTSSWRSPGREARGRRSRT